MDLSGSQWFLIRSGYDPYCYRYTPGNYQNVANYPQMYQQGS
jgi:hypothetical protein